MNMVVNVGIEVFGVFLVLSKMCLLYGFKLFKWLVYDVIVCFVLFCLFLFLYG